MSQYSKRQQIKTLIDGKKHTPKEISQIVDVSLATVYNTRKRMIKDATLNHQKGAGRPPVVHDAIKYKVSQQIRRSNGAITLHDIHAKILSSGGTASIRTVRRSAKKLKYHKGFPTAVPMLSEANRSKRILWAKKNKRTRWQHAIFADEASFWLSRGRVKIWTKGNKKRFYPTTKHSSKIHIWATFSSCGTFPLCIFSQNLTGSSFCKILEWHLLDQAKVFHENKWFLVQDNDPKHSSNVAKAWMKEKMPKNTFIWPSQSPDLNPIENLLAWIKYQLNRLPHKRPTTIGELKKRLQKIWENIDPDFLRPYWESMPKRCNMVLDNHGFKIKY